MHQVDKNFWRDKSVLVTGHTGFKGCWITSWLVQMGAQVTGIALPPEGQLYNRLGLSQKIVEHFCDIRDQEKLGPLLTKTQPDIVIHMAAQSLVRRSFREPIETFATNLMGSVNLLCLLSRLPQPPKTILVITSDKVYRNHDTGSAFVESDPLGGDDPYSASKACVELAMTGLQPLLPAGLKLATARAGNVIGGGDDAEDRLIPDIIRAWDSGKPFHLRNPKSTRPWQHVLDATVGYLSYAEKLAKESDCPPSLNFGPPLEYSLSADDVVSRMEKALGCSLPRVSLPADVSMPEKQILSVDANLAQQTLGWRPRLSIEQAIIWTADWHKAQRTGADMSMFTSEQIAAFERIL